MLGIILVVLARRRFLYSRKEYEAFKKEWDGGMDYISINLHSAADACKADSKEYSKALRNSAHYLWKVVVRLEKKLCKTTLPSMFRKYLYRRYLRAYDRLSKTRREIRALEAFMKELENA